VFPDPCSEDLTVSCDGVPLLIEHIVPIVISMSVGRVAPCGTRHTAFTTQWGRTQALGAALSESTCSSR
jgi:hypothetical protein